MYFDKTELIIHADDLGISNHVNNEIMRMMDAGIVTSSSILANGPAFDEVVEVINKHPECSYGVHLNITEFMPVSNNPDHVKLVNSSGLFDGRVKTAVVNSELIDAIVEEWSMQIEKVRSLGIDISHVDSHGHTHTFPKLKPALISVLQRNSVKRFRLPSLSENLLSPGINLLDTDFKQFTTTGTFCDYKTFRSVNEEVLLKHKSIEVMIHPGFADNTDEAAENIAIYKEFESFRYKYHLRNYNHL